MLPRLLLRSLALCILTCTGLFADVIQLEFTTAIDGSNMTAFPVGQSITIRWSYESSGSPGLVSNQQAFYANQFKSLEIISGGYNGVASNVNFGQIVKYDNLGNTDGVQFRAMTNPAAYQYLAAGGVTMPSVFSTVNQTFEGIYINFISQNTNLFNNYALPISYDPSSIVVNFGIGFSGGSFGGNNSISAVQSLTVTNLSQIPEPASFALVGAAAGVLMLAKRLRRA